MQICSVKLRRTCQICNKVFLKSSFRIAHETNIHCAMRKIQCTQCSYQFPHRKAVIEHFTKIHAHLMYTVTYTTSGSSDSSSSGYAEDIQNTYEVKGMLDDPGISLVQTMIPTSTSADALNQAMNAMSTNATTTTSTLSIRTGASQEHPNIDPVNDVIANTNDDTDEVVTVNREISNDIICISSDDDGDDAAAEKSKCVYCFEKFDSPFILALHILNQHTELAHVVELPSSTTTMP